MEITIQLEPPFSLNTDLLRQAIHHTLTPHQAAPDAALTVVITDTATVQELNRTYRQLDAPTDVLSFATETDPDFPGPPDPYLGDIIIAQPIAEAQARRQGHTTEAEIILLAIHGTLHLLGYDHTDPATKQQMWQQQQAVLQQLGLGHIQPTEG